MIDYDEASEAAANASRRAAAAEETFRGLSTSLSCGSSGSAGTSDTACCCSPPTSPKRHPLLSSVVVDLVSINQDQQQEATLEKTGGGGGIRHRRRAYPGDTIILTDMAPALLQQQSVRQRGGGAATGTSSTISSVTATPPESPLHMNPSAATSSSSSIVNKEEALDQDRLLLPQSALMMSHGGDSSSSYHRYHPRRSWIRNVWNAHLAVCILVIFISVGSNPDSRKYIIIDPHQVDATCKRVFLNVMASSPDEKDAIICCEPLKSGGGKRRIPKGSHQQEQDSLPLWINQHVLNREDDIYDYEESGTAAATTTTSTAKRLRQQFMDICPQPRATRVRLPLVNRLSRFPDAWLLPLFPLLIRMCLRLYQCYLEPESPTPSPSQSSSSSSRYFSKNNSRGGVDTTFGIYTFRRLLLYFMIMLFRGAFLFMALNGIEDQIARASNNSSTIGAAAAKCWYSSLLKKSQPECYGRIFDFSDHIVLYFAQLLPIALLEYLHSLERPYWPFRCFRKRALPVLLTLAMLYLYTLVFLGVYKTAAYFHTTSEIIAGFIVSLLGSLPLGWVQCSESPRGRALRHFFFGRTSSRTSPPCYDEKLSPPISASSLTP